MVDKGQNQRQSSIELLRIIAMVMIMFHHFSGHGGFHFDPLMIDVSRLWWNFIVMGGKIGVDLFVLITGYFLITAEGPLFSLKKVLKFWGQLVFYSAIITGIFLAAGAHECSVLKVVKSFFPITMRTWWFASAYFVLFLIHPFLNRLLHHLSKRQFQALIVLCVICWCIIPTFTTSTFEGNDVIWFVCLYCVAAYLKLYGINPKWKSRHYIGLGILFIGINYLTSLVITLMGAYWPEKEFNVRLFYYQESLTVFLIAIFLFMGFATWQMSYRKWINVIAGAAFGVYLIHDHKYMRQFLWTDLFHNASYQGSAKLILYSIGVVALVYVICTLIDLFRLYVIEKPMMKVVSRHEHAWMRKITKVYNCITEKIFNYNEE